MTPDTPCTIRLLYGAKPTLTGRYIETVVSGGKTYRHVWVEEFGKEKWYLAEDVRIKRRKGE